jgi:hypothetical protein
MARTLYGGTGAEVLAQVTVDDGDYGPATGTFNVYTERACTNQHTDLQTLAGILFFGVDSYVGAYYLRPTAEPTAEPYLVHPQSLTTRVTAIEAGGGGYVLPPTGIPLTDLAAAVQTLINNAVPKTVVDVAGDLLVATGADTITRKAIGSEGQIPVVRAAQATRIAWETPASAPDLTGYATKAGSVTQLGDVSDTLPTDDQVLMWDTNQYVPVSLTSLYASADPSTGKLLDTELPAYTLTGVIVNDGQNPPATTPIGAVVLRRQPSASLVPTLLDENSTRAVATVVLQPDNGLAIGDWFGIAIGASGESTGSYTFPAAFNIAFQTGAATLANTSGIPSGQQSGTAQAEMRFFKCTTAIPALTNITITCRNTANSADQVKPHLLASIFRMPNISSPAPLSNVLDAQSMSGNGANVTTGLNTTYAKTITSAGSTSQPSELALSSIVINSGSGTEVRVASPSNSWQQLSLTTSTAASAGRQLMVGYKVLTIAEPLVANFTITVSGVSDTFGGSGAWAGTVSGLKGS